MGMVRLKGGGKKWSVFSGERTNKPKLMQCHVEGWRPLDEHARAGIESFSMRLLLQNWERTVEGVARFSAQKTSPTPTTPTNPSNYSRNRERERDCSVCERKRGRWYYGDVLNWGCRGVVAVADGGVCRAVTLMHQKQRQRIQYKWSPSRERERGGGNQRIPFFLSIPFLLPYRIPEFCFWKKLQTENKPPKSQTHTNTHSECVSQQNY